MMVSVPWSRVFVNLFSFDIKYASGSPLLPLTPYFFRAIIKNRHIPPLGQFYPGINYKKGALFYERFPRVQFCRRPLRPPAVRTGARRIGDYQLPGLRYVRDGDEPPLKGIHGHFSADSRQAAPADERPGKLPHPLPPDRGLRPVLRHPPEPDRQDGQGGLCRHWQLLQSGL